MWVLLAKQRHALATSTRTEHTMGAFQVLRRLLLSPWRNQTAPINSRLLLCSWRLSGSDLAQSGGVFWLVLLRRSATKLWALVFALPVACNTEHCLRHVSPPHPGQRQVQLFVYLALLRCPIQCRQLLKAMAGWPRCPGWQLCAILLQKDWQTADALRPQIRGQCRCLLLGRCGPQGCMPTSEQGCKLNASKTLALCPHSHNFSNRSFR